MDKQEQIFGKAARKGLTIDEINNLPGNRDTRTIAERAHDQHRANVRLQLEGARRHAEMTKRTSFNAQAISIAEKQLADAENAARAAGVL